MIDYKAVYLAKVFNGIQFVGMSVFIAALIVPAFLFLVWGAHDEKEAGPFFERYPNTKKAILISLAICVLGAVFKAFTPSKKDFAAMLATKISSEKHLSLEETIALKHTILRLINGNENQNDK